MIDIKCKHCNRHMGQVEVLVGEIICPNSSCKGGNQLKIVTNTPDSLFTYKFMTAEKAPKVKGKSDE